MEETTPAGRPIIDREKTAPFLVRTFIKIGSFHRLPQFEEGTLPIADEQQIFTWKDATLREVLTTLRATAPALPEIRHPLARYSFRALYADSATRGRVTQKELGVVYSRDILGEPGSLDAPAARLLVDEDIPPGNDERTLDELRFVPGDYLCVAVHLPKNATVAVGPGGELAIKGTAGPGAGAGAANGWKNGSRADGGWGGGLAPVPGPPGGLGRGGGHWRGDSNPAPSVPRGGRGGRGGDFSGRDVDRRVPPPRRDSPPPIRRDLYGDRDRGGRRASSRSRSPPRRRGRYD
ncbi:uncharacterized protein LAESUDRAFT_714233 [Laetiporus sulphureus 93-53]|uniref:SAP18-domain-containing protein n=1 Tax=Laetiporus sulphureus 93-53 TaxID=1314785 RepID=A0A165E8W7_9APHY|nr:uncharacterized protein LAESUDRAFT_714233 [Laetiporus sulphureus 93-53]KZT06490.1 hypothetical protein LAESUDRAFT_714233 [Laetiporus sulphureus 93-53]